MKYRLIPLAFTLGLVDQINDGIASVELTRSDNKVIYETMHVDMFPCMIYEGDLFYFVYVDGVTEIRCGEPPD